MNLFSRHLLEGIFLVESGRKGGGEAMTWRHVIGPVFTCVVVGYVWQEEIHELLLSFAEVGATVVRLKGGDPLVRCPTCDWSILYLVGCQQAL